MQIWVDADACPKVIKEILFRAAVRTKTALILVGQFLGKEYNNSKLYDKDFKHEYRS